MIRGWPALLAVLGLAACGPEAPEPPPEPSSPERSATASASSGPPRGILLVTLDTLRADRVGAYGHDGGLTPTLDRLAGDGIVFEQAVSTTPVTLPSHVSILTGVYPTAHGVRTNGAWTLEPEATLLSEVLQAEGWRTGAFVGAFVLDARFGLDQGFDVYRGSPIALLGAGGVSQRSAADVVNDARRWLETLSKDDRFFLWVHFYDAHIPYQPPSPWSEQHAEPYDGEVAYADAQLGKLLGVLEALGLADSLLVAVTADHGESLGDHGEKTHGILLYQPVMRVPLLLSGPALGAARGTRVEHPVSNASLAPTLLRLAGLAAEALPDVRVPPLLGPDGTPVPADADASVYVESLTPYYSYGWHAGQGLFSDGHKLIRGRSDELYAPGGDPEEQNDLAAERGDLVAELRDRLDAEVAAHAPLGWSSARLVADDERTHLEALGYVVGDASDDPFDPALPDPRERLPELDLYDEAMELIGRWNQNQNLPPAATAWQRDAREAENEKFLTRARILLLEVQRRSPGNVHVPQSLGSVEVGLGNYDTAIPLLEQSMRERPDSSLTHYSLGTAYIRAGREREGLAELYRAIEIDPEHPNYYHWLAKHYHEHGDFGRAAWWITRLVAVIEPGTRYAQSIFHWRDGVRQKLAEEGIAPIAAEDFPLSSAP